MADYRVPSQQADPISANIYPPALYQSHSQVQHNPHGAGDGKQDGQWEGVPQLMGNVGMQGEVQYRQIDAPNYNAAPYPLPPQPYQYPLEVPYVHMHRDVTVAEAVPAQAPPFAPEVQNNHDGLYDNGAHLPAADPQAPEAFPGVQPHAAPPADVPPANGLRNLAGRLFNNPDALVNMLRIELGPRGRFVVWIALELAEI